jgi:SNF2 family DNA or RNA helicase
VVTLELPDRKEYDLAEKDFINWLRRVSPEKARSAANAEYLVRRGYLHRLAGELKLKQCIEWVDNFLIQSDQKLILFGIHKKVIKPIFEHYKERAVLVDGSVTGEDRQKAVDGFTNNKNKRLFVGNMVAAGVGWNGTAASDVVFVELTWTPGLHTQAEDRPHRIGQKLPVFCHYLVAENTVEEDLCALLQRKQNTVSSILDGAEISGLELLTLMDNAMMKRHNKGIMPHGR